MPKKNLINMAFIGDRLVDTAKALGVYPSLMATALTPMIEKDFPMTRQIECTACVMDRKQTAFVFLARKMEIRKIILEKSPDQNLNPCSVAPDFIAQGFKVQIADFSKGTIQGILQTARILNMEKSGEKLTTKYEKELAQAKKNLPKNLNKRVLVLLGMHQPQTGEPFLLVEEQDLLQQEILAPADCCNVGNWLTDNHSQDKNELRVITGLKGLESAAPDLIALTCEAAPGLLAIHEYLTRKPEAKEIPALAQHAVFSLPHCCAGTPITLPQTIKQWGKVLQRM